MARDGGGSKGGEVVGDLAGELAGAVFPGLGVVGKRLANGLRQEWRRQGSVALRAAERASGMTREEIGEAIADDPRLVPLATRLLYAAGMNGHDQSLGAMGTAFGDAVRQREALEETEVILAALADLTDIHAEVLLAVSGLTRSPAEMAAGFSGYSLDRVQEACSLSERMVGIAVSTLVARGMVQMNGTFFSSMTYSVTQLGTVLLDVLEQHRDAAEED